MSKIHCPRLDHFIRLEPSGKFGKCGHMNKAKTFTEIDAMQNSEWLKNVKNKMDLGQWPEECVRCEMTENLSGSSIRLDMIERDKILRAVNKNYFIVGGVLDNICNSACQSCNPQLSTKIGSLESTNYLKINNYEKFFQIPQDRIVELDINGGEPTASPNYKKLLNHLPPSVKIVRINTNGSRMIPELTRILKREIRVIVTLSLDGTSKVHDYARWPIKWEDYNVNVKRYLKLRQRYKNLKLNMWTTLSCLNVGDLDNILNYVSDNQIDHSYGFCIKPSVLDIRYKNKLTDIGIHNLENSKNKFLKKIKKRCGIFKNNSKELRDFLYFQNSMREIKFKDYFNFDLNLL